MSTRARLKHFSRIRSKAMVKKDESHLHDWHELVMILGGEYAAECEGQSVTSRPGTVLYYGRGRRHAWRTTRPGFIEYYLLQFERATDDAASPLPFFARDNDGRMLNLFRRMEELFSAGKQSALLDSYLDVVLNEFTASAAQSERAWLARVRSFIYSRLERPIRLEELARAAGLSPFHFSRVFKKKLGVSPMRYLRQVRAEAALPLLQGTDLPHKVIAREIGLANERDLYRLFMDVRGTPPSALRAR
jgi:AraC-like DNA-binding protein